MISCSTWLRHAGCFCCSILTLAAICCSPTTQAALKSVVIEHNETMDTVATLKQSERRWIEVDLSKQRLIAWTGRKPSYAVIVGKLSTTTHRVLPFNRGIALLECRGLTTIPDVPYNVLLRQLCYSRTGITALVLQLAMVASM